MKIIISDKNKKDLFIALFQSLKNCSSVVSIQFDVDKLHIQGMDKSHVCLFDVNIQKTWFDGYDIQEKSTLCIDTNIFHLIISTKSDGLNIVIHNDSKDEDNLHVDLLAVENANSSFKGDFNKYFKIPLVDFEYEEMNISLVDYDAEFSISAKKICDIVSQMLTFGTNINVKCSEETIDLVTNGIAGEMLVNIPIQDLTEYSIVEGGEINLAYSLNYINKMCLTNKLTNEIDFSIGIDCPMKISYNLGDGSSIVFFIAPKIQD